MKLREKKKDNFFFKKKEDKKENKIEKNKIKKMFYSSQ